MNSDEEGPLDPVERMAQRIIIKKWGKYNLRVAWDDKDIEAEVKKAFEISEKWFEGRRKWRESKVKKVMSR